MIDAQLIQKLCNQLVEHQGKFVREFSQEGYSVAMWAKKTMVYFSAFVANNHFEVTHYCPSPKDLDPRKLQQEILKDAQCWVRSAEAYALAAKNFLDALT